MNSFWAVFKRELKSYFTTPLAYVFLVIFLFFAGYLTFKEGFYEARQADLRPFFTNLPLLFVFMVPSTAMRLWAEERKIGSVELLFTLPVTIVQAVLAKFPHLEGYLALTLPEEKLNSVPALLKSQLAVQVTDAGGAPLGMAVRLCHLGLDDQTVAVFHQRMADEAEAGAGAGRAGRCRRQDAVMAQTCLGEQCIRRS